MVAVPTLALMMCFIYSRVVLRSKPRLQYVLDAVAFLPHAVPAIVFAVSGLLLALYVFRQVVPLYGTLALLLGVHVLNRLSFGTRVTNSALIAVSDELEEAAEVCGAGKVNVVRRILLPLVSPALINAFFWISLLTFRELTLALVLFSPNNITLSVVVWEPVEFGAARTLGSRQSDHDFGHATRDALMLASRTLYDRLSYGQ